MGMAVFVNISGEVWDAYSHKSKEYSSLFFVMLKPSHIWSVGEFLGCRLCPFDVPPSFLEYLLAFLYKKVSGVIFSSSFPALAPLQLLQQPPIRMHLPLWPL